MIVDSILFFKELDLLEIRLNILNEYVDKFLILESEETFTGISKPLYFHQNKDRFKKFLDKIEYIKCPKSNISNNAWGIEQFQRNYLYNGLENLNINDIIILSDCDEIPDFSKTKLDTINDPHVFLNNHFSLRFNLMAFNNEKTLNRIEGNPPIDNQINNPWLWFGSVIVSKECLDFKFSKNLEFLRKSRGSFKQINGGWHFSSCMPNEDILYKTQSYSHAMEYLHINSVNIINTYVDNNSNFINNDTHDYKVIEITENYLPKYLVKNKHKYQHLFK